MEQLNGLLALSWKEPYGSLMLHGKIETRTWSTLYRGPVLICASKRPYPIDRIMDISGYTQFYRILDIVDKFRTNFDGHAFAIGTLIDCRPMTLKDEDLCFVQYRPGLFCHIYEGVRPIKPFPYKGGQKWTRAGNDIHNNIELL